MKKILLPTDFSPNSKNAISYALNFYRDDDSEFTFLHAYEVNGYVLHSKFVPVPDETSLLREKEKIEKELSLLIQDLKMQYPKSKHHYKTISRNEALVSMLKDEIADSEYELIIIGTQGVTNAKDVSYGTNTINIMEEVTNCPIFAIPSHIKFSNIREIVHATGFKTAPQSKEYSFIKELIRKTNAELRILHIGEYEGLSRSQNKNKELLTGILKEVPHSFHALDHVSVPIGIYCFTESRNSDMITFINKKHGFFENVLFNPLYKKLGNYSKIPVLILQTSDINLIENEFRKENTEKLK